jgi:glycosyltransferase involved in cell wall biosynthesis
MPSISPTPIVSIGMPVYNGAHFLRQALDSILAQTYTNFELIISDNCSTDNSYALCEEYAARDTRIRLLRNERNMGAVYNYHRVLTEAHGKYFRYAAHDDVLAHTNIERCVEILEREQEVVLCYPRMQTIDTDGKIIASFSGSLPLREKDPISRWLRFHRLCNDGSMCDPIFGLFRTSVLHLTPGLGNFISADMVLLGEIALRGQIHEVPEFLFFERVHAETSVAANPALDDRAAWFDPNNRGKIANYLPHWIWLIEYLRAITRVAMSPPQKFACVAVMFPWIWYYKRPLVLSIIKIIMPALRFHSFPRKVTLQDYE